MRNVCLRVGVCKEMTGGSLRKHLMKEFVHRLHCLLDAGTLSATGDYRKSRRVNRRKLKIFTSSPSPFVGTTIRFYSLSTEQKF